MGCKTIQVPKYPERIDMTRVRMESIQKNGTVLVSKSSKNEYYVVLHLNYAGAGLRLIEGIKLGHILSHKIIIRNSEGKVIGSEPINFQAFEMTTTTTIVSEKNESFVLSQDASKLETHGKPGNPGEPAIRDKVERVEYRDRTFSDQD